MLLPQNYYWIPGYETKYALQFDPNTRTFKKEVYSFIYPGRSGNPTALEPKGYSPRSYALTRNGHKTSHYLSTLIDCVEKSSAWQVNISLAIAAERPQPTSTTLADSKSNGCWMIAKVVDGTMQFSDNPKQHLTQVSAYLEAERLAMANAGTKYVVVKTVRMVVAGGITSVDY